MLSPIRDQHGIYLVPKTTGRITLGSATEPKPCLDFIVIESALLRHYPIYINHYRELELFKIE